jgi:hypothetical protein
MLSVEERCLESLAWQQGSSLYTSLIAACGTSLQPALPAQQAQHAQQQQWSPSPSPSSERQAASSGATPRKRGLEEADAPEAAAGAHQQRRQQPQQSMFDSQGRLPLFLGCDVSAAAVASQQASAAAAAAAGQHATLAALGDRSARAAVRSLACPHPCLPACLLGSLPAGLLARPLRRCHAN